jgi:hypothetical protein
MDDAGTGHTGTYQAWERAPELIVVTTELAVALDNLIAVARLVARGEADRTDMMRELGRVQALHDFDRFNLGGGSR